MNKNKCKFQNYHKESYHISSMMHFTQYIHFKISVSAKSFDFTILAGYEFV
jgi:hypothetical protein